MNTSPGTISRHPRGFTLVEIMIVVVIIGLLAALAIPAFLRSRNAAIEKTILHDARQLATAAAQHFTESGDPGVTLARLTGPAGYMRSVSAGLFVYEGKQTAIIPNPVQADTGTVTFSGTGSPATAPGRIFAICHPAYRAALSDNAKITSQYDADANVLNFATDTGELLTKDGRRWGGDSGIYGTAVDAGDTP